MRRYGEERALLGADTFLEPDESWLLLSDLTMVDDVDGGDALLPLKLHC